MKLSILYRLTGFAAAFLFLCLILAACGGRNNAPVELTAIPISTPTLAPATLSEPTTVPVMTPTELPAASNDAAAAPTSPPIEPTAEPTATTAAAAQFTTLQIVAAESEARFTLGELLAGVPTTVIGISKQLAGEMVFNLNDLRTAQLGVIQISARDFVTDNSFRNRAIQDRILQTGTHPLITFTPTRLIGLPAAAAVGDVLTFTIEGELTIRDITQTVTFTATVTIISETRLEGTASTSINRADFELQIPNVASVANVDEVVLLEIEFVAAR
ncbi:MAG: YceI family protein [Anaerolineae bacterium]|nr:YceI family protein [Anaerolineae bacterium]